MLKHLLGIEEENTVGALKAQLCVLTLEVVLLDSLEEYYELMAAPPAETQAEPV